MKKLNKAQITTKSVEISKCLINTAPGLVDYDLGVTRRVGDAARLAVAIRSHVEPINRQNLAGVSSALKMDFRVTESDFIPMFENLDWIEVKYEGKRIATITEKIPPAVDILSTLGTIWEEQQPTPIDKATIYSLAELSRRPYSKEALLSELDVKGEDFEVTLDYGETANYLGKLKSEEHDCETIWTPLYWATNYDNVASFIRKQNEERLGIIGSLTDQFRKFPGMPIENVSSYATLLGAGIHHGFFPSVAIGNRMNISHQYVFSASPQFQMDSNADIYEKARLIVSCLRHGQYHAEISKILYPRAILNAMRNNIMKPHPYADVQYAVLVLHGIVKLEPAQNKYGKAYRIIWIDTPENNLAAEIADSLLQGEAPVASKEELEAKKILIKGMYSYSSELRKLKTTTEVKAKKEYDRLIELVSGVKL
ncbi:MAG TPA: hypothetical protein VIO58_03655 [Candidatus Methanoperedens sp.]